jgi:outer membrane protein W
MMKRLLLATTVLALLPAMAFAQEGRDYRGGARAGNSEITQSGTGTNNNNWDSGSFGVSGSYGYFTTNALELGIRQSFSWAGAENSDDNWSGATRVFGDYHFFTSSRFRPFVGINIGYIYGDAVNNTGTIGPEIGFKYFVNDTTFVMLQTEYQWFFDSSDDVTDSFDDGAFQHTIGLGFVF